MEFSGSDPDFWLIRTQEKKFNPDPKKSADPKHCFQPYTSRHFKVLHFNNIFGAHNLRHFEALYFKVFQPYILRYFETLILIIFCGLIFDGILQPYILRHWYFEALHFTVFLSPIYFMKLYILRYFEALYFTVFYTPANHGAPQGTL